MQSPYKRNSLVSKETQQRVLSTISVISLCYFNVCGGPVGSEQIISAGGPLIGIIGLCVFPFFWSIPVALMTAELATAFPEDGGYILWVQKAFGSFLGFQEGYWSWISGVVDNAIYPTLIISVISEAYGVFGSSLAMYCLRAAISIVLALPGLYGVNIVGQAMTLLSILVVLPFLVMFFLGLSQADWTRLQDVRYANTADSSLADSSLAVDWKLLLNILFWNMNGFQGTSIFAGEVKNPKRAYPISMVLVVILVILTYLIPLAISTAVNEPEWWTWNEGSLSKISFYIGGPILQSCVVAASIGSNVGLYCTELFIDSFQLLGMAEHGLAPSLFMKRDERYNTPRNAIYASLVIILVLSSFDFEEILVFNNTLSALGTILTLLAIIKLRISHAHVDRPFKVPGGVGVLVALSSAPIVVAGCVAVSSLDSLVAVVGVVTVSVVGILLYFGHARYSMHTGTPHELRTLPIGTLQ